MKRRTTRGIFVAVLVMWVVALWGLSVGAVQPRPAAAQLDQLDQVCETVEGGPTIDPEDECPTPSNTSASPSKSSSSSSRPPTTSSPSSASPTGSSSPSSTGTGSPSPTGTQSPTPPPPSIKEYNSSVTIRYRGGGFRGRVRSSSDRCEPTRSVVVKRVKRGRDEAVGKTRTDQAGSWQVRSSAKGKYYAKVKAKSYAGRNNRTIKCKPARSRTITV